MSGMIERMVTSDDEGIRPAGADDECFYCHQKVGQRHKMDCVMLTKKGRIRLTIELPLEAAQSFDAHTIEFMYTKGSWCHSNLTAWIDKVTDSEGCCGFIKAAEWLGWDEDEQA